MQQIIYKTICDRCGAATTDRKHYYAMFGSILRDKGNGEGESIMDIRLKGITGEGIHHLCPKCLNEFCEFIAKGRYK